MRKKINLITPFFLPTKKISFFFIFFQSLFFSFFGYSKGYLCQLNQTKSLMENTKGHQFLFRPENYQKGNLKISFKDSTLLIWNRLDKIHILLGSKKKKVSVKTSFSLSRNQFSLTLNPSVKLKCTKINESPHQKNKNHSTNLNVPSSGDDLQVTIKKPLLFKYYTVDGFELTRSLIFQKGIIYNQTRAPSQKDPWCLFRIEFKLNEDTLVPKGIKIPVKRAEAFKNNENFIVYSYSFVDFSTGKKGMETSRFIPFSIECTVNSGVSFSKKLLERINQGAFTIERKN